MELLNYFVEYIGEFTKIKEIKWKGGKPKNQPVIYDCNSGNNARMPNLGRRGTGLKAISLTCLKKIEGK